MSAPVVAAAPAAPQAPVAPGNWVPSADGLRQMLVLFSDPDPNLGSQQHAHIYAQLATLSKHPEFTLYLAYIVLYLPQHAADVATWVPHAGGAKEIEEIRARAGLELKNRIKDHWAHMDAGTHSYVQATALAVLGDPSPASSQLLRNIVGTIVTTICKKEGLDCWPGILQHLVALLDSPVPAAVEGGFNALAKICEDMPRELDKDIGGVRPLNFLIPKFITFFQHPSPEVRKYALATVNVFLQTQPMALFNNLDAYLNNLFVLAGRDAAPQIRLRVCQAFVILLDRMPVKIEAHLEQVMQFMLMASNDADPGVRLEACEFWSTYCDRSEAADPDDYETEEQVAKQNALIHAKFEKDKELLRKYLDHLIPILLKCMCYSEEELATLGEGEDEEDQYVPDRQQDMKPRFHRSQATQSGGSNAHYPSPGQVSAQHMSHSVDEDDDDAAEDEEDDDDYTDDDEVSNWTLRKCAAAALDALAGVYRSDLLPYLLPKVQDALNSKSEIESEEAKCWIVRESGVLALGAIAEGCFDKLRDFLPMLIPFLITHFLTDKKPLVRSITCWTLSRYCKWIISETVNRHANDHTVYFAPLLKSLLARMLDKNKKVQEAACSAFATLEEEARTMIVPYLKEILTTIMFAYEKYQANNLLLLYDCLGTLSEAVHVELNNADLIPILMPPLMRKWNVLKDDDRNLFPLLECLTAIAQALGKGFFVFAEPVFERCMLIIEKNLIQEKEATRLRAEGHDVDLPDKEFIVCALDLLSGLAEGLEGSIESLIGRHEARVLGLLFQCIQDLDPDVRQSAFALLGDLAKTCMGHLRPYVDRFLPIAARNLNPEFFSVCNNASWAIGEMAVRAGGEALAPFVPSILAYLSPILLNCDPGSSKPLLENASITIGRLAFVAAPQVAPYLEAICAKWLCYLAPLRENTEKEHAFRGLTLVIQCNPQAIYQAQAFPALTSAIASWTEPTQEMASMFHQLLHSYKNSLGPQQWEATMATCDAKVTAILRNKYQL